MTKQHLLLANGDARNRRIMETSLKRAGLLVTCAERGKEALEKARLHRPDLVLADTNLEEVDGFELFRAMKSDPGLSQVPFILFTREKSLELTLKGIKLGADDFLTSPFYVQELVARVKLVLRKSSKGTKDFSGRLADMGIVDLVQTFEMGRKTGIIRTDADREGAVYIREGKVIDAEWGRLKGEEAFYRLVNTKQGRFQILFAPVSRPARIALSTQALLIGGIRRSTDEGTSLLPPTDDEAALTLKRSVAEELEAAEPELHESTLPPSAAKRRRR